ncbi:GNAT family N-acetyltransferase [Sphingomonas sp. HITSZ_GF]|uniref:GNAT family N-acetyltransferase n=1 Tax=Sphingomonas sp. HITSZ_GF TaxID=3037247 RepID=UPI00240E970B|nr:GNAT family N-acetyltransferase [Sphingomonas sp. HITSZ_GF]MDG2534061.1 GNAT family N-acetyltransferase [Sphingomonas sp. HITSZ_GF]
MHPLDNPAWAALCTSQKHIARSNGLAQRYESDYAIFATAVNHSYEPLAALGALIAKTGPAIVLEKDPLPPVPNTIVQKHRMGVQMLAEAPLAADPDFAFHDLTDADAPEMLALATLTEPGPFFARTHRLGRFIGIRREGKLIAMAGERMRTHGFTEVSGVCTHPDFRGLGLAGRLMREVAARIVESGEVPFLHAYADNAGAIGLYERLGYRWRADIHVTMLAPAA